jgi:hypothetical protein
VEVLTNTGTCEAVKNVITGKRVGPCAINIVSLESELYGSTAFAFVLQVVKAANSIVGSMPNQTPATDQVKIQVSPSKSATFRAVSLTPNVCKVDGLIMTPLSSGVCEIKTSADENEKYLFVEKIFQTTIYKQSQSLTLNEKSFVATTRKGKFSLPVTITSGLTPWIRSLSPSVCTSTADGKVMPKTSGECRLAISQPGNSIYNPAAEVNLVGFIVNDGFKIICSNGKVSKKVFGAKPKCPSGYKKK